MHKGLLLLLCLFVTVQFYAQSPEIDAYVPDMGLSNDSLVFIHLEQVDVYPRSGRRLNYRRYSRLVSILRKVYPFAVDAAIELEKYNELYENATNDRQRRQYVRAVERELFAKHENELRRFTITEGRYLILLVDRQTGNSSYSILREIKGGVPALFWQGIAKIFNNDLKSEYDPHYEHYVVEQIVLMIEAELAAEVSGDNK